MPLHASPDTRNPAPAPPGRLRRVWAAIQRRTGEQAGFTIVEVLVAAVVLIVGLLTTFNALDLTAHTSMVTRAREGAVNLARQIDEDARSLEYSQLTSSSAVTSDLQAMPGLASTSSGSTWTVYRRNITYTISVTEADQSAVSQQTLSQKQITTQISWTVSGQTRSYTETTTISSGGQGLNLDASSLQWASSSMPASCVSPTCTATAPVVTASMSVNTMTFSVQTPAGMSGVAWEVNGVQQSWSASSVATNATTATWTTTTPWSIASLPDGTYEIGAAAQDGSSTGTYVRIYVRLARSAPSTPSFTADNWAGYGFDTNLYSSGTKQTAVDLDWSGSNNPASTGNSGDYNVVGYQLTTPGGTVCKTALTSQSWGVSTFPAWCNSPTDTIWCSSATACTDLSPPSTTASNLTYTLAALYYDATNTLTAGTSTSAIMSGQSATTYTLAPTTQNTSTNCGTGNPQNDLRTTYTAGSTTTTATSTGSSVTANFCSSAATQTTTIGGGGTASVYFTNSSNSSCNVTGYLDINGGFPISSSATVAAGASNVKTNFSWSWVNPTLNTGDRINNAYTWSCGSSTKPVKLNYGSTTSPSQFVTGTSPIQVPNAPTNLGVSVATNSDGSTTATLTWTAPSSGITVHGYRIYRDGQNYTNRHAYDSATDLCSGTSCTYVDGDRSGTHTYYVTAVGNTTAGADMAESSMLGPSSAQ